MRHASNCPAFPEYSGPGQPVSHRKPVHHTGLIRDLPAAFRRNWTGSVSPTTAVPATWITLKPGGRNSASARAACASLTTRS